MAQVVPTGTSRSEAGVKLVRQTRSATRCCLATQGDREGQQM